MWISMWNYKSKKSNKALQVDNGQNKTHFLKW